MKKLENVQMERVNGGDVDAACGFAVGVGVVAAFATSPVAFATWGFIGASIGTFCGGSVLRRIYL
ncbi:hypothetical protein [Runella zeae]|uniref:hypothetical protein n=1 Tax=Runella zeae TaxID=94255 RepID=UPI002356CE88|nr:hypothetical protein [Runella zeae]